MGKTVFEQMMDAYKEGDYEAMKDLMGDYSPARIAVGYKVIREVEGYTAYCQAKRGEHTWIGQKLGLC